MTQDKKNLSDEEMAIEAFPEKDDAFHWTNRDRRLAYVRGMLAERANNKPIGRDTGLPFKALRENMAIRYGRLTYADGSTHEAHFVTAEDVEFYLSSKPQEPSKEVLELVQACKT